MNMDNNTEIGIFENLVIEKVNDNKVSKLIINYFLQKLNQTADVAIKCFNDVSKYKDIFSEFKLYLLNGNYNIKNPLYIENYSAQKILELIPSLTASGVYSCMTWLRDNPEEAKKWIDKGLPNKDVIICEANFKKESTHNNENQRKKIENLFETDENDRFIRLIIPKGIINVNGSLNKEMSLINKKRTELNLDEVAILKKYVSQLYQPSVINKTCSRNDLIKIIDNFYSNRDNLSDDDMIKLYLKVLNDLEGELLKYECIEDSRFVTFCRRDFLKEELTKSLLKKDFNQAFYDIVDYVKADTWISFGSVPNKYDFKKIDNDDCDYKKCGIVCIQEKEIILNMIQEFKNSLAGGKLTFDDRDNLIAVALDKLRLIPTGSEFTINQIIDNFGDIDDFNEKFDIFNKVIEESEKQGIHLEPTMTGVTGMPWANSFIKK